MDTLNQIAVTVTVNAPIAKVWAYWTLPVHITQWSFASDDWHCPYAENELLIDSRFKTRMEAKDGSMGFDFEGTYRDIITHQLLVYQLDDERNVKIEFIANSDHVNIVETFDPERANPIELQRQGWQAILNNFKKYVEQN